MKVKQLLINILIFVLMLLLNLSGKAQVNNQDLNVEETVEGSFNPVIKEAVKISSSPNIIDSTKKIPINKYSFIEKKVNSSFQIEPIAPAKMKGEPLVKLYRTHVKGGLGNYNTPLLDLSFNSLRSKEYLYSANYKHLSSSGSLNDTMSNSAYSKNNLNVSGKYFIDNYTIDGGFEYDRNVVNYYGYNSKLIDLPKDLTRQRFNAFSGNASFSSNNLDTSEINYAVALKYYNLRDLFDARENNVNAEANISKVYGKEIFGVNFSNDYYYNTTSLDTNFNNIIKLNPNVKSAGKNWQVKAGLLLYTETNTAGTLVHFYPSVDFNYNVIDNIIIPYVGIDGNVERNSYKKMVEKNPFLNSFSYLENTHSNDFLKCKYYGGIRGSLSSAVSFNTSVSYHNISNMAFFVNQNTSVLQNKFLLVYDDVKLTNWHGELSYQKNEKLRLLAKADYYKYVLTNLLYPWHKPTLELSFTGQYNLRDKIIVKADFFYQNARKGLNYYEGSDPIVRSPFPVTLKQYVDLNIGGEYRYTKRLSVFVNFNNLGAVKYAQWNNYPLQRFNLIGGFTYSF